MTNNISVSSQIIRSVRFHNTADCRIVRNSYSLITRTDKNFQNKKTNCFGHNSREFHYLKAITRNAVSNGIRFAHLKEKRLHKSVINFVDVPHNASYQLPKEPLKPNK